MESLKELSKATGLGEEKRKGFQAVTGSVMVDFQDVEGGLKLVEDIFDECLGGLESKEKDLRIFEESMKRSCEGFDSRRKVIEAGLKRLDDREMSLERALQKMEMEVMQPRRMRESVDKQTKGVLLKEGKIHGALKLDQSPEEKKRFELDLMEETLRRREDGASSKEKPLVVREELLERRQNEIDSRQEKLEARLHELESREGILVGREEELFTKEEKLEKRSQELDYTEGILVGRGEEVSTKEIVLSRRENEVDAKEKLLEERSFQVDSKEKDLEERENILHSEAEKLSRREKEINSRDEELINLSKQLEAKAGMLESLKPDLCPVKNLVEQSTGQEADIASPTKSAEARTAGRKRVHPDGEESDTEENNSKHAKGGRCNSDERMGQIEAQDLQKSGTRYKAQAKITDDDILDDPESNIDSMTKLPSNPNVVYPSFTIAEKGQLVRNFNVGEVWACFDGKDYMPRSYAKIIGVIDKGGKTRIEVAWLKPYPARQYEKDWIRAGLPVACGNFERGRRRSVELTEVFSHPILYAGSYPLNIIPYEGETWAIYKDWSIASWVSDAKIHRHCTYEIVEILSDTSSSVGFRVVHLVRIRGSMKLFERGGKNDKDSILIMPKSLYRFSHKVPSTKKLCIDGKGVLHSIFELDYRCLPLRLK